MALTYFINQKSSTTVVSLNGTMAEEDLEVFQKCLDEVNTSPPKYLIINLGGLTDISKAAKRPFTMFQTSVRETSNLIICNIDSEVFKTLKQDGVLRESEVQPDLMTALKWILMLERT